jgi:hypothetical protein
MTTEQGFRNLFRNPPDYGETLNFSEISVKEGAASEKNIQIVDVEYGGLLLLPTIIIR